MPTLRNPRHEKFVLALREGKSASQAYVDAGYRPCRQNASRLSSNDAIRQRVTELQTQRQTDTKNGRDTETGRFLPGNSGFGGRPKGSRNKLGEQFIQDLYHEWRVAGPAALKTVAKDDPATFCKIVAGILPRELDATLTIDADLFRDVANFREAFRLAKQYIGADDDPLLLTGVRVDDDN